MLFKFFPNFSFYIFTLIICNHCTPEHQLLQKLSFGYPFNVTSEKTEQTLITADSIYAFDRIKAQPYYLELLESQEDIKLRNYAVFQIRIAHHLHSTYSDKTTDQPLEFYKSNDPFTQFLYKIDSVFGDFEINTRELSDLIKDSALNDYFLGLGNFALAMDFKYYKKDSKSALFFFQKSHEHLKNHPQAKGMLVLAIYEAVQEAKNTREYLLAHTFGEHALRLIKLLPEDTLICALGYITAGNSKLSNDLDYSLNNYHMAYKLTRDSRYFFLHQEALMYLLFCP